MAVALLENGLRILDFSRRTVLALSEDIPPDRWCHQPAPGTNHPLWVLGHLAWVDEFFPAQLGQKPTQLGERWTQQFGMGSTPMGNPKDYPPISEIKSLLADARARLRSWFESMDEKRLAAPLPKDFQNFAPDFAGLMFSIAWHEGMHTGQLTVCRRSLGLKPKFG
jgi:hypothetical protein